MQAAFDVEAAGTEPGSKSKWEEKDRITDHEQQRDPVGVKSLLGAAK